MVLNGVTGIAEEVLEISVNTFRASTKYGDFKGTAAADIHDTYDLDKLLRDRGQIEPEEHLVAVRLLMSENGKRAVENVTVLAFLAESDDAQARGKPLRVRRVEVDMTPSEFLGLFKRFSVVITRSEAWNDAEFELTNSDG